MGGIGISLYIPDIERCFEMISFHHQCNILRFQKPRSAKAFPVCKILSGIMCLEKGFNIAILTVADDHQRNLFTEYLQRFTDRGIKNPSCPFYILILIDKHLFPQIILLCFRHIRIQPGKKGVHRQTHAGFYRFHRMWERYTLSCQICLPCIIKRTGCIPQCTVQIK